MSILCCCWKSKGRNWKCAIRSNIERVRVQGISTHTARNTADWLFCIAADTVMCCYLCSHYRKWTPLPLSLNLLQHHNNYTTRSDTIDNKANIEEKDSWVSLGVLNKKTTFVTCNIPCMPLFIRSANQWFRSWKWLTWNGILKYGESYWYQPTWQHKQCLC